MNCEIKTDIISLKGAVNKISTASNPVLVIGDVMLDRYLYGKVDRISPEAPIPVVHIKEEISKAGGAANVALNLNALKQNVDLIGVVGNDNRGKDFINILNDNKLNIEYIITDETRETTSKTRIIANGKQQILRIDRENTEDIKSNIENQIINMIDSSIEQKKYKAIAISDYNKGLITKNIARYIIDKSKKLNIPVLLDSKTIHYRQYKGIGLIKPNQKECSILLGIENDDEIWNDKPKIKNYLKKLKTELDVKDIIVTRGEHGLYIYKNDELISIPAQVHSVYDVTGAGDVTMAWLTAGIAFDLELLISCILASQAASLSVTKLGATVITTNELEEYYEKFRSDVQIISYRC